MSNFLAQLRAKAKENQNASQTPATPAHAAEAQVGDDSVADGTTVVPQVQPNGQPAESARAIEGTESKPAEAPATQAKPTGLALLASLNRRAASVPAAGLGLDSKAGSIIDDGTTDGDEDDSPRESPVDSSGRGDAPVNAATIVEGGDSTAVATIAQSELSAAELFKLRLASLAELCETESGITSLVHDSVKAHVAGIMIDLRDNPEMRGLLLDRDMHNLMMFIQSSTTVQQNKVEKTQTKRAMTQKKAALASAFDTGFDMLDNVPSLSSVGNMSTDNIETKVR